jgi:DNA-binding XRE family transcriptional regulator
MFNNSVKQKCEEKGMTLRDLALKAGIAESTVYSLSAGKIFPYPAWRKKIAKVFGCNETEIFK